MHSKAPLSTGGALASPSPPRPHLAPPPGLSSTALCKWPRLNELLHREDRPGKHSGLFEDTEMGWQRSQPLSLHLLCNECDEFNTADMPQRRKKSMQKLWNSWPYDDRGSCCGSGIKRAIKRLFLFLFLFLFLPPTPLPQMTETLFYYFFTCEDQLR